MCCSSRGHRCNRAAPAGFIQGTTFTELLCSPVARSQKDNFSKEYFPSSPQCAAPARPSGAAGQPEGCQHPPARHGAQALSPRCCAPSTGQPAPVLGPQPPRWPAQRPCKWKACLAQPVIWSHRLQPLSIPLSPSCTCRKFWQSAWAQAVGWGSLLHSISSFICMYGMATHFLQPAQHPAGARCSLSPD